MNDFENICNFQNLFKAHMAARKGKRNSREVIEFEMNLSENLTILSDELKSGGRRYWHCSGREFREGCDKC